MAPRSRRKLLVAVLAAVLLLLAAGVGGLYWVDYDLRHPKPDSGRPGAWMTMDAAEVSLFTRVAIPTGADDVRWGYREGFQDDFAVLAFRLSQAGLEEFRRPLPVTEWAERTYIESVDLDGFQHIGAPDPSNASPLTCGGFLSPGQAKNVATRICVASRPDGTGQVWVSAFHTP
ncbi:hypothetical protein [Streptomyces sp. TLI_053]|uniref:hypothetical protein n=1 Tax=Streptomyces sp. TLI_053 TaxID=1855352 RepID=UPI0013520C61|nr:hypothetical protein [Streptomyces sp. TLI_053]